jgi:hypothetical protein
MSSSLNSPPLGVIALCLKVRHGEMYNHLLNDFIVLEVIQESASRVTIYSRSPMAGQVNATAKGELKIKHTVLQELQLFHI